MTQSEYKKGDFVVIARRKTFDGKDIYLWACGAITWALGFFVAKAPLTGNAKQREFAIQVGWMIMDEVAIFTSSEISGLIEAGKWAVRNGKTPGEMRAKACELPRIKPNWELIEADSQGRPVERVWRLNRMQWPGMSVWWRKGTYSVWTSSGRSREVWDPTGVEFTNLDDLSEYLRSIEN